MSSRSLDVPPCVAIATPKLQRRKIAKLRTHSHQEVSGESLDDRTVVETIAAGKFVSRMCEGRIDRAMLAENKIQLVLKAHSGGMISRWKNRSSVVQRTARCLNAVLQRQIDLHFTIARRSTPANPPPMSGPTTGITA